jgi:hypothetical protein
VVGDGRLLKLMIYKDERQGVPGDVQSSLTTYLSLHFFSFRVVIVIER